MEEEYRASGAGKVFKAPEPELTDEERKQQIDMEKERYLQDPDQEDLSQQVNYSKEIDEESLTNRQKQKQDAEKWKEFDDAVAGAKSKEDLIEAGKIRKRLEGNWVSLATLAGETFIGIGADVFLPSPDPLSRGLNYGIGYGTNVFAQWLRGEEFSQGQAHAAGLFQAIPFGTVAKGAKGITRAIGKGAVGGVVGEQVRVGIDEKRVLTPEEVGYAGTFGGAFGGLTKGALDNVDLTSLKSRLSKQRRVVQNLDGTLSIADDGIDLAKQSAQPMMSKGIGDASSTGGKTRNTLPKDNEFHQLVMSLDQEGPYKLTPPGKFVSKTEDAIPEIQKLQDLTTQEIESLGSGFKTYMGKRPYKDAATPAGMERMQKEVNSTFEQLLGPDFDQDLVRGYMKAVADHEGALLKLQEILNDKTGKLWDRQHATALRNLEHSGRMLGNKGLFPAFNYPDTLDQTPLGKPKVKIEREGNRPDRTARGADFQRTLARVLGKPLSLEESILYWYDQDMFYFWKELTPLQRQQLVDSSRTRSGGRLKSELTVAENINQALEFMKFGKETMSGKLGRKLTPQERLEALVSQAQAELLKKRKYKGIDLKSSPRQGNVFYDIQTGKETDYRPDLTGKGAYYDIESE